MTSKPAETLLNRSFSFFTTTQFLGAFNDNVLKQMILLYSLGVMGTGDRQGLATVVFALPFILFSGNAGQLAEMYAKTTIMRSSKIGECLIMLIVTAGFYHKSEGLLLFSLFLMGAQSAYFGPAKFGAIPELIENRILVDANGVVTMTTFLAIILGQAVAGPLIETYGEALQHAALYMVVVSILGIVSVYAITPTMPNRPEMRVWLNPFGRVWRTLKEIKEDKPLLLALVAGSFFFFSGALVTLTVNNYGMTLLNLGPTGNSILLVHLAIGIMVGCLITGPLQRRISGKWTIFTGAVGVALSEIMLYYYTMPLWTIKALLASAGLFTGLYYVPIATFMQSRPKLGKKGEILAAYNFTNFVGILIAGIVWQGVVEAGVQANLVWWGLSGALILLLIAMFPQLQKIE